MVDARVWLGYHFRTADTRGARMGQQVAEWALDHYFPPVGRHKPLIAAAITRIIADHEVIFRQPTTPLIQATVFQRWRDAINGSA